MDVNFIILVVCMFLLFKNFDIMGKIESFAVTGKLPAIVRKPVQWQETYARTVKDVDGNIIHAPVLVNYWPMEKAPSTIERTPAGPVDLVRADFIPHMTKRV